MMQRWQIFCAVALRRLPEVMPRRDPIEIKVQEIFDAHEASMSRYSQHELQHMKEVKIKENPESEQILKETAQDRLDKWLKVKSNFSVAEYEDRLSKTQYLFIKSKFGTDIKDQWLLPQINFDRDSGDQDLIDSARRALKENLNIVNGYKIISKVPSSYASVRYPRKIFTSSGYTGAKVFFLKANLDRPSLAVLDAIDTSKNELIRWLTRDEGISLVNKCYMRGLDAGLLHEDRVDVNKVLLKAVEYTEESKKISVGAV